MEDSKRKASLALSGVIAALGTTAGEAEAEKPNWEEGWVKCAGIVEAGQNDCGSAGHGCAGKAKRDRLPNEWIYLPKGTCDKIAGGEVIARSDSGDDGA